MLNHDRDLAWLTHPEKWHGNSEYIRKGPIPVDLARHQLNEEDALDLIKLVY